MLKLQPFPTFKCPAHISIAGQERPIEIEVEFKYFGKKDLAAYYAGLAGKSDADGLSEIMVGWGKVDAPYSREALETLLENYPRSAADLFEAFRRELLEAKRKN